MRLVQLLAPVAGLVAAVNAWDKPTSTVWTTEIVTKYTTYCPSPTTIAYKNVTYTVTEPTTLTITNCPCTISHHKPPPVTTTCPPPPPPPPCTNSTVIYPNTTAPPPPGTTVITYPPTTELSGTTVISRPPPTPTTSPAHVTAAAATVGSGIGAIGLIAGFAALVL